MQTEVLSISIENVKVGDRVVVSAEGTIVDGKFSAPIVTVTDAPEPIHPGEAFERFLQIGTVDGNGLRSNIYGWIGSDKVLVIEDVE